MLRSHRHVLARPHPLRASGRHPAGKLTEVGNIIYRFPNTHDPSSKHASRVLKGHGTGEKDSGWTTVGRAGFILDNLIAAKKAVPMLVDMPNGRLPPP